MRSEKKTQKLCYEESLKFFFCFYSVHVTYVHVMQNKYALGVGDRARVEMLNIQEKKQQ